MRFLFVVFKGKVTVAKSLLGPLYSILYEQKHPKKESPAFCRLEGLFKLIFKLKFEISVVD